MNKQLQNIILHILIALLSLPIHYFMGEVFKLALLPYILFLLFSKNPNYLPALIIHTTPGNTISLLILLSCVFLTIANYNTLKRYNVTSIINALLLLLPIFLYYLYDGIFVRNIGLSFSLQYLGFYLSFFAFFYGILIANKMKKYHWYTLIIVVFLMPIIMYLPLSQKIVIRLFWLALPFAITILVAGYLNKKLKLERNLRVASILFIVFIGVPYGLKFTPIFSSIIAVLILYLFIKGYKTLFKFITKPRVGIITIVLIMLAINNIPENPTLRNVSSEDLQIVDFSSLMDYVKFKTFDDRAVLWKGGWDFLINSLHFWPTGDVPSYSFYTSKGSEISEVEFGMHNLGLELMRNYGIIIGAFLTGLYLMLITRINIVFKYVNNPFILILSATLLGLGIAEALVGQAVLMSMFSFTFIGLIGVCYAIGKSNSYNLCQKR